MGSGRVCARVEDDALASFASHQGFDAFLFASAADSRSLVHCSSGISAPHSGQMPDMFPVKRYRHR